MACVRSSTQCCESLSIRNSQGDCEEDVMMVLSCDTRSRINLVGRMKSGRWLPAGTKIVLAWCFETRMPLLASVAWSLVSDQGVSE